MRAEVQVTTRNGVLVATLAGEIDMANVTEVRTQLLERLDEATVGLIIDLTQTTYIDSRGIYALQDINSRLEGGGKALRLVCADGSTVRRVLELAQIPIPIDAALDDALNHFHANPPAERPHP